MQRFKNILCVVGVIDAYRSALERAVALAENNQAHLTLIDVITPLTTDFGIPAAGPISGELQEAVVKARQLKLESLLKPYQGRIDLTSKVILGTAFLEIIREVIRNKHDLVITAAEPQDWLDRLFSSEDMHLLRKCPCPVWIIKPQAPKTYRRILAAVDVADSYPADELKTRQALNWQILEMASSLALSEFAGLHIVHAWEAIGESAMRGAFLHTPEDKINAYVDQVKRQHATNLDALINAMTNKLGQQARDFLQPQTHLVKGLARKEIPVLAKAIAADLVVMGTVARTGVPGFIMGNTAETILNQLDCSVLAIKPPGFITPVTLQE